MTTMTPERIVELWPSLTDAARRSLIDIAEGIAATPSKLALTDDERAAVERSRQDFRNGRVLSEDEYRHSMNVFMRSLPRKA